MDVIELHNGKKVDTTTGKVVRELPPDSMIEVPTNAEAVAEVKAIRRRISDLPVAPKQMNTLSVVMTYTLFGLADNDIAYVTGLTSSQIGQVRMSGAYRQLTDDIIQSIMENDAEKIRTMFRENANVAAANMRGFLQSEDEILRFQASKDALDRDGHRPADVVEHRVKVEGGLEIVYKDNEAEKVPVIDAEFEQIEQ